MVLPTLDPAASVDLCDDTATITSELVTNALRAGADVIRVTASITGDRFRIGVQDDAPGLPVPLSLGPNATHGRGLRIVQALSAQWGVVPSHNGSGKEVWAELALTRSAGSARSDAGFG